jgi:hypothetical protein
MSDATPVSRPTCPLCGGSNACAVAANGRFDACCWCAGVELPPEARAALRASGGGIEPACACAACLQRIGARRAERAA